MQQPSPRGHHQYGLCRIHDQSSGKQTVRKKAADAVVTERGTLIERSMKCGAMWARSSSPAGCGMPSITGLERSRRMCLAAAKTRYSCSSKPYSNPLASCAFLPIIGEHTPGYLAPEIHVPGKRNTQQIERKHLTLRTRVKRLARKTICFSKSTELHDIVIGLFVNRYEFGLSV